MGVYIPNMEMPTSCADCRFAVDGWCYACQPESKAERKRITTNYCPLVPVPNHGRLIDADALMGVIRAHDYPLRAHFNSTDNGMFTIGIQQAVDEAPTIIPAEEGE